MFQSIPHMLFHTINEFPSKDALRFKWNGELRRYTYHEFGEKIKQVTHGLASRGLLPGDKIAILSNNRPEWTISDFAAFCLRGVVVPIYQTLPSNQIHYILNDSNTRAVFVENQYQLDKIIEIKDKLPNLEFVFIFEPEGKEVPGIDSFSQLLTDGETHLKNNPGFFETSLAGITPKEICSLVYTSGTTGEPKGVMLHHHGFVMDVINAEKVFRIYPEDVFLSFLPLSHLYERLAGHWCPMYRGATIHYAGSIETVVQDISEATPSVMVSVPRLYEKIAAAVLDQVEQSSPAKRKIFFWAMETGKKYYQRHVEGNVPGFLALKYRLADKLAFRKIKMKLGGKFRFPISGGAPLPVETLKFFEALGLQIIEGYGMTETHLIITLTPTGKTRYGSCGKPIDGVEVKIDDDGEILVKGDTIMAGYYNKPELSAEVIENDGWFHTGDIGYMDDDNYLYITDRIKNIIVTSGGKNIASAPIENTLKISRYIDDVCLIGDKRKYVSALIVPNYDAIKKWAGNINIEFSPDEDLSKNKDIINLIWFEIERLQEKFARYEKVKKFAILPVALSIDKGELTPSLKIKRNVVEKNYNGLIEEMYED